MALSKKNLNKLKSLLNKENKIKNTISEINTTPGSNSFKNNNSVEVNNTNQIFYSIIDNSEYLEDTILSNNKLKNIEEKLMKENKTYFIDNQIEFQSNNQLSEEDLMYDEFNYLLDE
tara:strand:+ start:257 stop:607 length:351 start_codon:yes stop_codon:yes gene_type:complete